jgi:hypothetical protein
LFSARRWSRSTIILSPFGRAVRESFAFPDRRSGFELVDDVFARIEGLGAMRRRRRNRDCDFSDGEFAYAMNHSDIARSEPLARFGGDAFEFRGRHLLMRFVGKAANRTIVVGERSNDPLEGHHRSAGIGANAAGQSAGVDRLANDREH